MSGPREPDPTRGKPGGEPEPEPTLELTPPGSPGSQGARASEPIEETTGATQPATERLHDGTVAPVIPGVTVEGVLGRGGQGVVFRGRQSYLERDVAVKVLASSADATFAERFQREAKILAGMHHRFIVSCYQAGVNADGRCFIVMEYIDGPDLAAWTRENGPLAVADALALVRDVAVALEHAHTHNVIHRDVKPQNVLLSPSPCPDEGTFPFKPKLADLGLARATEGDLPGMVTAPGSVIGTPATMALEQIDEPDTVDFRADIYGLGCVLFHALAGEAAYAGMKPAQVFKKKAQEPPPDIKKRVAGLPRSVRRLVRSMMDADRTRRPQSYAELIERLEAEIADLAGADDGQPARAGRRLFPLLAGIALVLLVAGTAYFVTREEDPGPGSAAPRGPGDELVVAQPDAGKVEDARPDGSGATGRETADTTERGTRTEGAPGAPVASGAPGTSGTSGTSGAPGPAIEAQPSGLRPAMARGEQRLLFAAWDSEERLLAGWDVELPEDWSSFERLDQVQVRTRAASATALLPAGAWELAGEVAVRRPFGWSPDELIEGGVALGFGADRAVAFLLHLPEGGRGEAGWSVVQRAGERWEPLEEALPIDAVPMQSGEWIGFRVRWDGSRLTLQVGPDPVWTGAPDELGLPGRPLTLGLTARQGIARWRDFVLSGL